MANEKLNPNMKAMDMVMVMCEANPEAMQVLMQLISDHNGVTDILLCDSLDIRGSKLYILYNDCCGRNIDKFKRTLMMFRCGVYTEEEIQSNLNLIKPMPFIDDSLLIGGIPPYGEEFDTNNEKWSEYCKKNRNTIIKKLNALLERQNSLKKL